MGHLLTVLHKKKVFFQDSYNRLDNAVTMGNADTGQAYVPASSTWGISGNRAYSVTDVTMDVVLAETGNKDFSLYCTTNGQTQSTSAQRLLNIVFRANDSLNFLMTRVTTGAVNLYKNVAGTLTLLASNSYADTDNVDIKFNIRCRDNQVVIYANGVKMITYALVGGETVFMNYTKVGYRLTKGGTPTGTARADEIISEAL